MRVRAHTWLASDSVKKQIQGNFKVIFRLKRYIWWMNGDIVILDPTFSTMICLFRTCDNVSSESVPKRFAFRADQRLTVQLLLSGICSIIQGLCKYGCGGTNVQSNIQFDLRVAHNCIVLLWAKLYMLKLDQPINLNVMFSGSAVA